MTGALLVGLVIGCGYTVSSPPVPTTVDGYKRLFGGRTFETGSLDSKQSVRIQLRTDGECLVIWPPDPPTSAAWYSALKAALHGGGNGLWHVEQDGDRFSLVIRQQSGLPWARGAILYQQRTDMAAFEKDAVFFEVCWESGKQSPTIPSPDATRTWWYSIAIDHP